MILSLRILIQDSGLELIALHIIMTKAGISPGLFYALA